jgi:hypothetical protein
MSTTQNPARPAFLSPQGGKPNAKPDSFAPATLADAYACGLINARHAVREELARVRLAIREKGGSGSHAARRALALADVALHERLARLAEGAGR